LLGLKADIDWGDNTVVVKLDAAEKVSLPASLRFRMLHATYSSKDIDLELLCTPAGTYLLPCQACLLMEAGTYNWKLKTGVWSIA